MATTIRTYRHTPNVSTDPTGTLVDTEVDADDGDFSVTVPTTGWTAGNVEITVTAQKDAEAESLHSNAMALTVEAAASVAIRSTTNLIGNNAVVDVVVPSIQDGDVVVVLATNGASFDGATCTSSNLTFTRRATQQGSVTAEVWTAVRSGATLTNETVSYAASSGVTVAASIIVLSGASTTALTNTAVTQWTTSTAARITLTAQAAGSYILMAGRCYYPRTGTPDGNTTEVYDAQTVGSDTVYNCRSTDPTAGSGSITIGGALDTNGTTNCAGIEIRPA